MKLLVAATAFTTAQAVDLAYRYTDHYELAWKDTGSGATDDGSFWKVENFDSSYCSLGDVVRKGHSKPDDPAVLVTSPGGEGVKRPTGFSSMWWDGGSDAKTNVRVWRMNPPSGYSCLGDVVVSNYQDYPNRDDYCCIHNSLLVSGQFTKVWTDGGSGSDRDFSGWLVQRGRSDATGILASNIFRAGNGYYRPKPLSSAKLINGKDGRVLHSIDLELPTTPLKIYEVNEMTKIYEDRGSDGLLYHFSIWRSNTPKGFYSLGDVAVQGWDQPLGFMIKVTDAKEHDAVHSPIGFKKIWDDEGSGAKMDCTIWKVSCPAGYGSLGHIATNGKSPGYDDVYCVNQKYITTGAPEFDFRWRSYAVDWGKMKELGIYEQRTSHGQQGVNGFFAVPSYNDLPTPLFVLKESVTTYVARAPLKSLKVLDIKYDLGSGKKELEVKGKRLNINKLQIANNDVNAQSSNLLAELQFSETSSFSFTHGIEFGIELGFEQKVKDFGLPFIGEGEFTMSQKFHFNYDYKWTTGTSITKTRKSQLRVNLTCEGKRRCLATVVGDQWRMDVPYEATVLKTYIDGTTSKAVITGTYKGSNISSWRVVIDEPEVIE